MTSYEIAKMYYDNLKHEVDMCLPYGYWQSKAENNCNDIFHIARDNKRSITAVAKEIMKVAEVKSQRETEILSGTVAKILRTWYNYGWLTDSEKREVKKIIQ